MSGNRGRQPRLRPGDSAPWFRASALQGNKSYAFDTAAGGYMLLLFFGLARLPQCQAALQVVISHRHLFDDKHACFFGITVDPADVTEKRIAQSLPGIRHFLDYDRAVSRAYGAALQETEGGRDTYHPHLLLLDPMLRVIERFAIGDSEAGGQFRPRRDNTTRGTAHRRFAATINLNAEDYDGGDLRFSEFGPRTYRAPSGGAVIFSCSLLHEATPDSRGTRYAILPFLYDDAAAREREANNRFLCGDVAACQSGLDQGAEDGARDGPM